MKSSNLLVLMFVLQMQTNIYKEKKEKQDDKRN